ncbi:flippase [Patescibacteria group bacterium]|nr:flippase [Patescibacteria group bacterium]
MKYNIKSLLFVNTGPQQIIFKNTFWLAIAEAIIRLLKLGLIIYVARILGVAGYGKFTFALSFVSLFVVFSDFGLSAITTREFAGSKEKEFSSIFSLKILLSLGTLILILLGSFFITPEPLIQRVIWVLAIFILSYSFSEILYALLRARQQMQYEAAIKILQAVLLICFAFFVILKFPSVLNLSYAYLFAGVISLVLALVFFHIRVFPLKILWQISIWKKFLFMSWPLGLVSVFGAINFNLTSIILGYFGQLTAAGWYNAAWKIANVCLIPSILISQSFFPALSRSFKESKQNFQSIWNFYTKTTIFLAMPLVIGGITLAPRIISFIYPPEFAPSILVFQILIVMVGLVFISGSFSQALLASNQQIKILWIVGFGAVVNIVLNLILIPKIGLYGGAIAVLSASALSLPLLFKFILRFTSIFPFNRQILLSIIGAAFSSIFMYLVISQSQIYILNIFLTILIGAGVYFLFLFGYRKLIN